MYFQHTGNSLSYSYKVVNSFIMHEIYVNYIYGTV